MNRYKIVIHKSGSTDSHAYRTSAKGAIKFAFDQQREAKERADRFSCYSGVCSADIYRRSNYLFRLHGKPMWVLAAKVSSQGVIHIEDTGKSNDGIAIAKHIAELEGKLEKLRKCERELVLAANSTLADDCPDQHLCRHGIDD